MFIKRVRANMHICLAFSPIGSAFRDRLRKFPALVNCCTIDWFFAWPKDALIAVAASFLQDIEVEDRIKEELVNSCQYIHDSVRVLSERFFKETKRVNYVTPTSYLELIRSFRGSLSSCRAKVSKAKMRYEVGLEKLGFAATQVAAMQKELQDLLPGLKIAKTETDAHTRLFEKCRTPTMNISKIVLQTDAREKNHKNSSKINREILPEN